MAKKAITKTVLLKSLLAPVIATRQAVEEIVKQIPKKSTKVVIDFKGVEFISRSFAHEFHRFQEKNPAIKVENQSEDVRRMFEVVLESNPSKSWDEDITNSSINLSDLSSHL